jgi:hypothetical protein
MCHHLPGFIFVDVLTPLQSQENDDTRVIVFLVFFLLLLSHNFSLLKRE